VAGRAIRSPIVGGDGNVEFLVHLWIGAGTEDELAGYVATCRAAVGAGTGENGDAV
jgi:hypothetical protein